MILSDNNKETRAVLAVSLIYNYYVDALLNDVLFLPFNFHQSSGSDNNDDGEYDIPEIALYLPDEILGASAEAMQR